MTLSETITNYEIRTSGKGRMQNYQFILIEINFQLKNKSKKTNKIFVS